MKARAKKAEASGGVAEYDHAYQYDELGNIRAWVREGVTSTYGYDGSVRPHAVMTITVGGEVTGTFGYDDNGNMTGRDYLGDDYEQRFDVENRLVVITDTKALSVTTFAYDADGMRVKTVRPDGVVVYTPFPSYEEEVVSGTVVLKRSSYSLAGRPVALRVGSLPATPFD